MDVSIISRKVYRKFKFFQSNFKAVCLRYLVITNNKCKYCCNLIFLFTFIIYKTRFIINLTNFFYDYKYNTQYPNDIKSYFNYLVKVFLTSLEPI